LKLPSFVSLSLFKSFRLLLNLLYDFRLGHWEWLHSNRLSSTSLTDVFMWATFTVKPTPVLMFLLFFPYTILDSPPSQFRVHLRSDVMESNLFSHLIKSCVWLASTTYSFYLELNWRPHSDHLLTINIKASQTNHNHIS
jgi:hypothetical protein